MRKLLILFSLFFLMAGKHQAQQAEKKKYVLVIHGGAGTIPKSSLTPAKEAAYHAALDSALRIGEAVLAKGGLALDAVEASVRYLEDNPLFNAGRGAVFTNEGKNELDASIMDGRNLAAGAIAGVTNIKNPITAARAVMEKSPHVMLAGKGAEKFAAQQGIELVDPSYFFVEDRFKALQRVKERDSLENLKKQKSTLLPAGKLDELVIQIQHLQAELAHCIEDTCKEIYSREIARLQQQMQTTPHDDKFGTVGAVALDQYGNLAAATSTGGMTNKKYGRIGDAPIIGAGTYANNQTVAVSGTGWGEYFIRLVVGKSISDMMEYGQLPLDAATTEIIMKKLPALGGDGGVIAVDKNGNISTPFCTSGMYRGFVKEGEKRQTHIWK